MIPACLIVAQDPWFIQLIKAYSSECGYHTVQASAREDVIPIIYKEHPIAVFIRVDQPNPSTCEEIILSIKNDPRIYRIPILIFYTQLLLCDEKKLVGNVSAIVREPVNFEDFTNALKRAGVNLRPTNFYP